MVRRCHRHGECEGERDNTVVIYAEHMYILARDAVMAQDPLRGQNNALCRCMVWQPRLSAHREPQLIRYPEQGSICSHILYIDKLGLVKNWDFSIILMWRDSIQHVSRSVPITWIIWVRAHPWTGAAFPTFRLVASYLYNTIYPLVN